MCASIITIFNNVQMRLITSIYIVFLVCVGPLGVDRVQWVITSWPSVADTRISGTLTSKQAQRIITS